MVEVDALDPRALAGDRERARDGLRGPPLAGAAAAVARGEADDAAGLREPHVALHGAQELGGRGLAQRAEVVRVGVAVQPPDARALRVALEGRHPRQHVGRVEHVGGHDRAAAALLAHHVVEPRRPARPLVERLGLVVGLVPRAHRGDPRVAGAELAHDTPVLADRRQAGGGARVLVDGHEHVGATGVRGRHPLVVAAEVAGEDAVVVDEQAHLADAELLEALVLPQAGLLVAHADGEGLGGRGERQAGAQDQGRQEEAAEKGHGRGHRRESGRGAACPPRTSARRRRFPGGHRRGAQGVTRTANTPSAARSGRRPARRAARPGPRGSPARGARGYGGRSATARRRP